MASSIWVLASRLSNLGTVLLVAGLPGSGKSTYLRQVAAEQNRTFIDDFKAGAIADNRQFNYSQHFQPLIAGLHAGESFLVTDVDFCRPAAREEAEVILGLHLPGVQVSWVFFENDPEACVRNVRARAALTPRNLERELQLIRELSAAYELPANAAIVAVWGAGAA